jgi:hypothetical protein
VRSAAIGFVALLLAANAQAAEPALQTEAQGTRVWINATAWPRPDSNVFALGVNAQWAVRPTWMVDLALPFAAGRIFGESGSHAAFGNVVLGSHGAFPVGSFFVWWVGGALAIPTIYDIGYTNDSLAVTSLATLATFANNSLDPERFFPEYLVIVAHTGFELSVPSEPIRLRADLSARLGVGVGVQAGRITDQAQGWMEFEVALPAALCVGVRGTASTIGLGGLLGGLNAYGGALYVGYAQPHQGFEARIEGLLATAPVLLAPYQLPKGPTGGVTARAGYRF